MVKRRRRAPRSLGEQQHGVNARRRCERKRSSERMPRIVGKVVLTVGVQMVSAVLVTYCSVQVTAADEVFKESEAIEEPPVEAENVEPTASQTLTPAPASVVTSKKGKGQPPKKRVYHNQYTRPRETPNEDVPASPRPKSSLRNKKDNNSLSPSSRGANGREKETETNNSMTNGATSDTPTIPLTTTNSNRGKLKQIPRNAGEKTTSMRELERRAAGMLEYILHMQMEAGKRQDSGYARALRLAAEAAGLPVADGVVVVDAERPSTTASSVSERVVEDPKVWREMGTVEMVGSLAVQLEVWQRRFVG